MKGINDETPCYVVGHCLCCSDGFRLMAFRNSVLNALEQWAPAAAGAQTKKRASSEGHRTDEEEGAEKKSQAATGPPQPPARSMPPAPAEATHEHFSPTHETVFSPTLSPPIPNKNLCIKASP